MVLISEQQMLNAVCVNRPKNRKILKFFKNLEGGTYKDVNPNNEMAAVAPEGGNLAVFIGFVMGYLKQLKVGNCLMHGLSDN